jgi:hypothetical protein
MTLEEQLKIIDPSMNSDRVNALVNAIREKIENAKAEGRKEGLKKVQELVNEKDEECAKKFEEFAKTVDKIHTAKLEALAEAIDEDHGTRLQTLIEGMDTVYTKKLEDLYEAIDLDHTEKTKQLLEAIDEDRSAKLKHVTEVFEESAVEKVKSFMDMYIEEAMPATNEADIAKLARLEEAVNSIREILVVNDDFVQEEVKEALVDVKSQLDEARESKDDAVNDLMVENMELRKRLKKNEATRLLESITADMKPAQAAFVKKYFKDEIDADVISKRKDEAIALFEAEEADETEEAIEENRGTSVEIPDDEIPVIEEDVSEQPQTNGMINAYVKQIRRSSSLMNRVE